jgi:tetratricopeptide (TPR) repeat protein
MKYTAYDSKQSWSDAVEWALKGPLHRAVPALESFLAKKEYRGNAAGLLADIYARLGQYAKAADILNDVLKKSKIDPALQQELRWQLERMEEITGALKEVNSGRFDRSGFLARAVAPGGRHGYQVATLGFPGTWWLESRTDKALPNGAALRLCRSLLEVLTERYPGQKGGWTAHIRISPDCRPGCRASLTVWKDRTFAEVSSEYLCYGAQRQKEELRRASFAAPSGPTGEIAGWNFPEAAGPGSRKDGRAGTPQPAVLLISPGIATDYGISLLKHTLLKRGTVVTASFIRTGAYLEDYVKNARITLGREPGIVGISVLNMAIDRVNRIISLVRRIYPGALVFIGGPSASQHPEQCAALVPDFDILVRGYAEEVLPALVEIAGQADTEEGLAAGQLAELAKLPGLMARSRNGWLISRLSVRLSPDHYALPPAEHKSSIHYLQTSRGCPYVCRFCNKWSGLRYHLVSPLEGRTPGEGRVKGSARAVREWLLDRLALHFPHRDAGVLHEELLAARRKERILPIPGLVDKIFVIFQDDEFLAHRQRIAALHREITGLGLQHYFNFAAISSVRDLTRGRRVDKEVIRWLKEMNFTIINLGTDGLTQRVIDQNGKGYSLDHQVFPLNSALREEGILALNNVILTTPYTTMPELIESLIFMTAFPFPLNITMSIGILGRIGTDFNNEDLVFLATWKDDEINPDQAAETIYSSYRVPPGFPEFAVNKSTLINCADPQVQEAVVKIAGCSPWTLYLDALPTGEIWAVVEEMAGRDEKMHPESSALGKTLLLLRKKNGNKAKVLKLLEGIREDMRRLEITSFSTFWHRMQRGNLYSDPQHLFIGRALAGAGEAAGSGQPGRALKELKALTRRFPRYSTPYREIIRLYLAGGYYRKALDYLYRLQEFETDRFFYQESFNSLVQGMGVREIYRTRPAFLHIAHYHNLSPLFYLMALACETAGRGKVQRIRFHAINPEDIERAYALLDGLTPRLIRRFVRQAGNIRIKMLAGEVVELCGMPVQLAGGCLTFDYHNCRPAG